MSFDVAVSGDSIILQRVSVCKDEGFREVVETLRESDVAYTHLETVIHDYDGPEVYPAAEGGGNWLRSPRFVAGEYRWLGFDIVSHAGNHALDYSYGGLRSTWDAMSEVDIPVAGTGENLADAREPKFIDTPNGRVALVSMTSSFTRWSRAGEARKDVKGRPGNNPLRINYELGPDTMHTVLDLAEQFGYWVTQIDEDTYYLNPPGIHNTITKLVAGDREGVTPVLEPTDLEGNLQAIEAATLQADFVIAHNHTHDHRPGGNAFDPPAFIEDLSRRCIDAGADVMVNQGTHAPARGIEVYEGSPIFYDPGDFFFQTDTITRIPAEFYHRHAHDLDMHPADAMPAEGLASRNIRYPWGGTMVDEEDAESEKTTFGQDVMSPEGGYFLGTGSIVPVCEFTRDMELRAIEIHPVDWIGTPKSIAGIPRRATGETASEILDTVAELSTPYETQIELEDDTGYVST